MNCNRTVRHKGLVAALLGFLSVTAFVLSFAMTTGAALPETGAINQSVDHSAEAGMYRYTLTLHVDNPVNTNDCDEDAICEFRFVFEYKDQNGYGSSKQYTLDMSYKNGRNQNESYVNYFKRKNDNGYWTKMQVWVPGIVSKVKVHLNMDGGERLKFSVEGIYLNGFRLNTNTDYVSSAYYDSDGTIYCTLPRARVISTKGTPTDCYGGVVDTKLADLYEQDSEKYGYNG